MNIPVFSRGDVAYYIGRGTGTVVVIAARRNDGSYLISSEQFRSRVAGPFHLWDAEDPYRGEHSVERSLTILRGGGVPGEDRFYAAQYIINTNTCEENKRAVEEAEQYINANM